MKNHPKRSDTYGEPAVPGAHYSSDCHKKLLNSSLDVICSMDGKGRFITVSTASKALWGYEPHELEGLHFMDLVAEADKEATLQIAAGIRLGNCTTNFENNFVCKDGRVKPILWSGRWDSEEGVMYAVAKDATEKKRAEEISQQQERRLRRAYHLAQIAWWELDIASQTYTCSNEIYEIYGMPVPAGNQTSMAEFLSRVHPEDVPRLQDDLTNLCEETFFNYEHRIIRPSGEVVYLIHHSELIRDEKGHPVAVHGFTKNITEFRHAQLQLEASQKRAQKYSQRLSDILESLGGGFLAVDRGWNVTYWNQKIQEITGLQRETVLHTSLWDLYPKGKDLRFFSEFEKAMCGNVPVHFEEYAPTLQMWMEVSAYPSVDGLSVYIKDITERKRHEEERRLLNEKLRQVNDNLQNVLESMSDGFYTVDREWTITFATDKVAAMLGVNKEAYIGKNLWVSFPELAGTKFYSEYYRAFAQNTLVSFEEYFAPFNMWFEANVYPKENELSVYIKDISERKRQEKALQTSNERFQLVCKATSEVIWDWNVESGELYINEAFSKIFGYEFQGKPSSELWLDHIHPEDKDRVLASQREALLNPEVSLWEDSYRFVKACGETAFVSDRAVILRNEEGRAARMIGAVKDITEHKKQERRLQFMAKATSEVIWERALDSEDVEINGEKFRQIFGYAVTGNHIRRSFWKDKVHPEDMPRIIENREYALKSGFEFYANEYRLLKADGTWAHVKDRTFLIKNEKGETVSMMGAMEDITPRRAAEKALIESGNSYRQLFDNAPLPTLISDAATLQYLDVNSAALEHFGYSREEFLTRTILDVCSKEEYSLVLQHTARVLQEGKYSLGLFSYIKKGGEVMQAEVSASLINYKGKEAFLVTLNDVTEKIKLQKQLVQEKVDKQKSITQAAIEAQEKERSEIGKELHDNVNQLLTTAKLYVENIQYYPDQSGHFIEKGISLLQKSINEIRRLSRALVTPTIRDVGFTDTLEELVESYRELHLFEISCLLDFNEADIDKGVKLTIYRILQESFNNTVKYAGASLVRINIHGSPNTLRLEYKDDGIGFDPSMIRKGIGLNNIKNRASAYKGRVQIQSSKGSGCHLKVLFPLSEQVT